MFLFRVGMSLSQFRVFIILDTYVRAKVIIHKTSSIWAIYKVAVTEFLKDSWRADIGTITSKSAVYEEFRAEGLTAQKYLATMHCGDDIPDSGSGVQRTRSQKHLPKQKLGRIHCRLVLNEIAHHMSNYFDTKNLITVVLCALHGMFN